MIRKFLSVMLGIGMCGLFSTQVLAKDKVDLGVEGAPASAVTKINAGLRKSLKGNASYQLLPVSGMKLSMARLTLGCMGDTPACLAALGAPRGAKYFFHVRLLPFGSRIRVIFRKIDVKKKKAVKTIRHFAKKRNVNPAIAVLASKMFGGKKPAPVRKAPPPRRVAVVVPPVRRPEVRKPEVRKPEVRKPEVRKPEVRKPEVRKPEVRKPEVRKPPVRRVVERTPPPVRRAVAVVKRKPPVRRIVKRAPPIRPVKRPVKRAVALVRKKPPVRNDNRSTPPQQKGTPLWKKPQFWAWVTAGVGVAALGGFAVFGVDARDEQETAQKLLENSKATGDALSYKEHIQPHEERGQTSAVLANVSLAIGVGALATSIVLFLLPKKKANAGVNKNKPVYAKTKSLPSKASSFSLKVQ